MSKERTGSCGCGKITARISGEAENVVVCYCIPCQKACGDALQTNVFFSPKVIETWAPFYIDDVLPFPLKQ